MSDINYKNVLLLDDNENGLIPYILPATSGALGVVKVGAGLAIAADGTISNPSVGGSQDIVFLSNSTVTLQPDKQIYYYNALSSATFVFDTSNLTLTASIAYTFELLLNMQTIYSMTFPSALTWQDSTAPAMTSIGIYFFAFRTLDAGSSWKGSLQGVWQ